MMDTSLLSFGQFKTQRRYVLQATVLKPVVMPETGLSSISKSDGRRCLKQSSIRLITGHRHPSPRLAFIFPAEP
jgi:hypothetical protein